MKLGFPKRGSNGRIRSSEIGYRSVQIIPTSSESSGGRSGVPVRVFVPGREFAQFVIETCFHFPPGKLGLSLLDGFDECFWLSECGRAGYDGGTERRQEDRLLGSWVQSVCDDV